MTNASAFQLREFIKALEWEIASLDRQRTAENNKLIDTQIETKKLLKSNFEQCLMMDEAQSDIRTIKDDVAEIRAKLDAREKSTISWKDRVAFLAITLAFNVVTAAVLYSMFGKFPR